MRQSLIVILCMLSSAAFAQEGSRRGLFFRPDTTFAVRHPNRFTIRPNVGAGYAYNWVLPDNWMLHASYLHCLSLYHHGEIAFTEGTIPLGHRVNHGGIVRLGSVWDNHSYFGGFTGTMQLQWMSHTPLSIFDFYVSTQLFFGFRF